MNKDDVSSEHRKRNQKRPFSPDIELKRKPGEKRKRRAQKKNTLKVGDAEGDGDGFSCAKCGSPYVVNPARRRGQAGDRRSPAPRRVFDSEANRVLLLCNRCGLAAVRAGGRARGGSSAPQESGSEEGRAEYLRTAAQFASSLAGELQDADAGLLYCPAFRVKSCGCLQTFITGVDGSKEEAHQRALYLLNVMKEARRMAAEKCGTAAAAEQANAKVTTAKGQTSSSCVRLRRSAKFENYVLTTRRYFKEQLKICEKACQRVLCYSNNFLHKRLKALPGKGSRVAQTLGRRRQGGLVPVPQLASEHCCADKCVLMALTHGRLLEAWRADAALGQRPARRALAEMLTPSGGAKSNCYRFISMVTGCSLSTICSVADQMRRTQGEREPSEHGLRRWWREHPRRGGRPPGPGSRGEEEQEGEEEEEAEDALGVHIPSPEELRRLGPEEGARRLLQQRDRLARLQRRVEGARREQPPPDPGPLEPRASAGVALPPQAASASNIIILQDGSEGVPVRYSAERSPGLPVELVVSPAVPSLPSVIVVQGGVGSGDGFQVFSVVDSPGAGALQYS
ncbi:uncharacterized protein LOC134538462 isoform X2 [Bacillus rossius redtenbacheri]|uniref:uncharacterized protein LOC134538462 isoform X2 n=1 Tax=Bacillus rossius redtenbacheri TaxID=93214 RepID=UPI002FDD2466